MQSEQVQDRVNKISKRNPPFLYYRFNVPDIGGIGLQECNQLPKLGQITEVDDIIVCWRAVISCSKCRSEAEKKNRSYSCRNTTCSSGRDSKNTPHKGMPRRRESILFGDLKNYSWTAAMQVIKSNLGRKRKKTPILRLKSSNNPI